MKNKRTKRDTSHFFVTFFIFFMFIVVSTISIVKAEIDKKEMNRLRKQNEQLHQEVIDYRWQTDQYEYMFNKYCGGVNNG